jgi:hypothetical protein
MEPKGLFQEKESTRGILLLKKIGLMLLIGLVIIYVFISIHFILS